MGRGADIERALRGQLPTLPAGPIEWLSPVAANAYKELRDDVWALVGVDPSPHYQVANRLAFLHWLHEHAHREAWLVHVYFTDALQIPPAHPLSSHRADVFLPAAPVL